MDRALPPPRDAARRSPGDSQADTETHDVKGIEPVLGRPGYHGLPPSFCHIRVQGECQWEATRPLEFSPGMVDVVRPRDVLADAQGKKGCVSKPVRV